MVFTRLITFSFLFSVLGVLSVRENYYWRNFNGTIPQDAVLGGQSFGHNIYIGQAYIRNEGAFAVTINPGVKEVVVPIKGVRRTDEYIKILCGDKDEFEWVPANATHLHIVLLDREAVIGGHEDYRGYNYIGRIKINGNTQIGKVNGFNIGDATLAYPDKNVEKTVKEYEVLTVVNFGIDLDIRLGAPNTTHTT